MGDKRGLINGRRPNKLQYIKIIFDVREILAYLFFVDYYR